MPLCDIVTVSNFTTTEPVMKKTKMLILVLFSSVSLIMAACSDDKKEQTNKNKGDHVWKQQTDTLKSAKEMAEKMQKNLEQQQQELDQSN